MFSADQGVTPVSGVTYIEDVFSTYLYTGNGSSQTITNGIDLSGKGGLVWVQRRDAAGGGIFVDTARGATETLFSYNLDAASAQNSVTSFTNTGFGVNVLSAVNANGGAFASWTFRKAPKFFDVVTYTGNGQNSRQISHNLGVAPGFVVIKRTDTAEYWCCYCVRSAGGYYNSLSINTKQKAETSATSGALVSSTTFTVNGTVSGGIMGFDTTAVNGVLSNVSGASYVAYLFANDTAADGLIRCGTYVGNGSADGPAITLGWEPQLVLIKCVTANSTDWNIIDNMRGMVVGNTDLYLRANLSDAEASAAGGGWVSPNATGFKITNINGQVNTNTQVYMYVAIRRGPMKTPTSGTSVFNVATGTYSGSAIVTGDLASSAASKVDLAWLAATGGNSLNFQFVDRLRGIMSSAVSGTSYNTPVLSSSSSAAEVSTSVFYQRYGLAGYEDFVATNSTTSVARVGYSFKRAPGFFDIVCYEGNNTTGQLVAHNLGVAPQLIICKPRSGTYGTDPWGVAVSTQTGSFYTSIDLNTNAASGLTTPANSILFGVTGFYPYEIRNNSNWNLNRASTNYVAYLFSTVAGVSKVGKYTGNGTSQTINCGFTAGARFVLIKQTNSTGGWLLSDSARGIVAGNDPYLALNTTAAEVTGEDWLDTDNSGFIVNEVTGSNANTSGATYIYFAIA